MITSYDRAVTPVESIFSLSPFSVVAMVFRIKGDLGRVEMEKALLFIRKKHPVLNSVIGINKNGEKIFTPAPSEEIEMEVIERTSEDHWKEVYHRQCAIPFEFDLRPCIRFVLLRSEEINELMIFSHHIICDGLSLAYLGRDMLENIGTSDKSALEVVNPIPAGSDNLPEKLKVGGFIRSILDKMNRKFIADREFFDFADYKQLHSAYWKNFSHQMVSQTLSEEETGSIIKSCKANSVSVNSAMATAVCGARQQVLGINGVPEKHSIAVSIRDRLSIHPGQGMGFFAGSIDTRFTYREKSDFWKNALRYHKIIQSSMSDKNVFKNILNWSCLEQGIMESLNYKILGHLTEIDSKTNLYSKKDDLVASLVRREKMDNIDNMLMATAVTNLGNLKFDRTYGNLELDSVVMNPGGAFPLSMVQLVVAASTVSGKLSILFEYEKNRMTEKQARSIMELTLKSLRS